MRSRRQEKKRQERVEAIIWMGPEVDAALQEISSFYSYNHYITESERINLLKKYEGLFKEVDSIITSAELEESPRRESIRRFYKAMSDTAGHKKTNNENFINNQLTTYSSYFDTVLKYPLDAQQREAVVSLEDNVLVISSAGSGKTMTTVAKVRYLIDVQKISPSKILLITFTRKAAESLSERLGEKDLRCVTFHKLALDFIGVATGKKPTITAQDFSVQVYYKLREENPRFRDAITDYIVRARYKAKDQFECSSMKEYMQDRKRFGVQTYFRNMDGATVFCKSDEESQICDFLGSRSVKYRYEEKYEFDTKDAEYRQYCPDFSIYINGPDGQVKRIYLEHFAINERGRCPEWFSAEEERKYLEGIEWKRELHRKNGTILLETSSADFHRGNIFEKLDKALQELGAVFKPATSDRLSHDLMRQEETILAMLTSFNFLLKSKGMSLALIRYQAIIGPDKITINDIVVPFVEAYQRLEKERGEIDFTDSIIWATELCNNGYRPDYDYILVDEFQDISLDRYRFLQALRRDKPLTKLFCVGDDWQSIYRFAGSDMALFKHFEEYFGFTKKCLMETTYRFGEPAIEKSSRFILANPEQEVKKVHSFRSDSETMLDFLSTESPTDMVETVKYLADQIPQDKEIMLLGRYKFDVNIFKNTDLKVYGNKDRYYVTYGSRKMNFLTVHQSKGLECDYIIILNCNGGTFGFPADIVDSPILNYVLSEPDAYAFSEERRIFYVGITRAKKHTWVLYDMKNPSPFVQEFISPSDSSASSSSEAWIPESERCPKCRCGRIRTVGKGVARNGNPYSIVVCSNEKYGCDYRDLKFLNLNGYYKKTEKKRIGF